MRIIPFGLNAPVHQGPYNYITKNGIIIPMLKNSPSLSFPEHASEKAQVVFDLISMYRTDNSIAPDMPLTSSQIAEVCQIVHREALKIEGIYISRK